MSDAAEKEYKALPSDIQDEFGKDLRRIQFGESPELKIEHLCGVGAGVIELKINGHPAHRYVYSNKFLHLSFSRLLSDFYLMWPAVIPL